MTTLKTESFLMASVIRAGTVSQRSVSETRDRGARHAAAEIARINQDIFREKLYLALYELQQSPSLPKCLTRDAFALAASPDGLSESDVEVAARIAEEMRALGSTPPSAASSPNTNTASTPPSPSSPTTPPSMPPPPPPPLEYHARALKRKRVEQDAQDAPKWRGQTPRKLRQPRHQRPQPRHERPERPLKRKRSAEETRHEPQDVGQAPRKLRQPRHQRPRDSAPALPPRKAPATRGGVHVAWNTSVG
ncbi:hypothetical protein Tdes44962_MAKER08100 [Teratosphaeria destructans]|uniref:Uncharacterized protein n=1 Tax=Teratosphaeria destructans TaxID=418781 RepID=A0A9W7W541_9PEZI|nr:hypothetical protein Tdes44962_MAKER08100 [Teratosphaeria destructans]